MNYIFNDKNARVFATSIKNIVSCVVNAPLLFLPYIKEI